MPSILSFKDSVESYWTKGMREAENEESVPPAKSPSFGLLGDALDAQLIKFEVINRATQTDWTWVTMAIRWRHARLLSSSFASPIRNIASAMSTVKVQSSDEATSTADLPGKQESDTFGQLFATGSTEAPREQPAERERQDSKQVLQKGDKKMRRPTFKDFGKIRASGASARHSRMFKKSVAHEKLEEQPDLDPSKAPSPLVPRKPSMNPNDKCMDNVDLEFDAYDPNLRYTPKCDTVRETLMRIRQQSVASDRSRGSGGSRFNSGDESIKAIDEDEEY